MLISLWLLLSLAVGIWAGKRGRGSGSWFLLACVISPLLAAIFLAVTTDLSTQQAKASHEPSDATHVHCPACREFVLPDAIVCKHCGTALSPDVGFHDRVLAAKNEAERQESKNLLIGVGFIVALIFGAYLISR